MGIALKNSFVVTMLLCAVILCDAQQAEETSVLSSSENGGAHLRSVALFNRSRAFDFGWNWGSFYKKAANVLVHTTLVDEKFGGTTLANDVSTLQRAPDNCRFIVADHDKKLLFGYGCGFMTRCDAEIVVDSHDRPIIESGTRNTGAVHGFRTVFGEKISHYRRLRHTDDLPAVVFTDNTNSDVLGAFDVSDNKANDRSDATRTNDMLFVAIKVRATESVVVDEAHPADDAVLRVRIERRKISHPVDKAQDPSIIPLHFSFIPSISKPIGQSLPSVGQSELPKFLGNTDFDAQMTALQDVPLNEAVSTTTLSSRERVWPWYTDTRFNDPSADEIVITRAMLQSTQEEWTVFDGLVVFWPPTSNGDRDLGSAGLNQNASVDKDGNVNGYGNSKGNPSLRPFNRDPSDDAVRAKHVTDLNIVVTYESSAGVDVDVDYFSFSSPNSRALMRDQYRAPIASLIETTIGAFDDAIDDPSVVGRGHKILGLRGPEELGEMVWYADRYLNILTGGLIISEQPVIPADRYRHITWPSEKIVNLLDPTSEVTRFLWNEGLTGRVGNFTPAPYLRGGASHPWDAIPQTWGLKYGFASARFWDSQQSSSGFKFREPCWENFDATTRRQQASAYEIGFDDNVVAWVDGLPTMVHPRSFLEQIRGQKPWWDMNPLRFARHLDAVDTDHPLVIQSARSDMPTLLMHERVLYDNTMPSYNQSYLFDGTPWLNQVWTYAEWIIEPRGGASSSPTVGRVLSSFGGEGRPSTGEELRRSLISGTIYGSAGVALFCAGTPGRSAVNEKTSSFVSLTNALMSPELNVDAAELRSKFLGTDFGADFAEPFTGYQFKNSAGQLMQTWARIPKLVRLDGQPIDVYVLDDLLFDGVTWSGHDATTASRFYIGLRSTRMELLRFTDLLERTVPSMGPLTEGGDLPTWREVLPQLRLVSFWNRGYETRTASKESATTTIEDLVDVSRLRTRQPQRGAMNGRADYESTDSIFVDVTYLQREDKSVDEEYWLGVLNRRTSPMIPTEHAAARPAICPECNVTFISSEEHFDEQGKQNPAWGMYEQDGARMIAVPMKFQSSDGKSKLLRVTEMGNSTTAVASDYRDEVRRIDTIIDASGVLELPYLPGEGKLFLIRPVNASAIATTGFLAFNSQTKLIVTPMTDALGTVLTNDEHVRYHMVTMRQNDEPGQPWRVYYRRSHAVAKDAVTDVGGLTWELFEITLGAQFRTFQAPLLPNASTMINNADGVQGPLFRYGQDGIARHGNAFVLNAAFPTITAVTYLEGPLKKQRLVVSWGQSVASIDAQINDLLLVETMIEDRAPLTSTVPAAQVLVAVQPAPWSIDDLAAWVTPSNGACYKTATPTQVIPASIMTAWSTPPQNGVGEPIRAIAKPCTATFAALVDFLPIPLSLNGKMAKYPTVTPQSPSSTVYDWPTSSLTWQEQAKEGENAEGWHIMYTLLQRAPNPQQILTTRNLLPAFQTQYYDQGYVNLVAPTLFQNGSVARLSDNFAGDARELNFLPSSVLCSGPSSAQIQYFNEPATTNDVTRDFLFEEVAWQERLPWETKYRVRRKFFLHERPPAAPSGSQRIRYWWTGTTYSQQASVITPTVTSGSQVLAEQQFTLSAGSMPLPEYFDPSFNRMTVRGNVSDTSIVEAHSIVPAFALTNIDDATFAWRTLGQPAINQVNLHHVPVPRHATAFVPADATLQDESGSWTQLSKVSALLAPSTKQLRRLQQSSLLEQGPPSIRSSAESFLRTTSDIQVIKRPFVGFSSDYGEVSMSFRMSDGTILTWMKRVRPNTTSEGLHPVFDAMYTPIRELVTEAFTVDEIDRIEFDVEGFLRNGVSVMLDHINIADSSVFDSVAIDVPASPATHLHISRATSQLLLAGGTAQEYYRLRATYFEPSVVLNDVVIEPLRPLERSIVNVPLQMVDLQTMRRHTSEAVTTLIASPNPSSSKLSVCIVPPNVGSAMRPIQGRYEIELSSLIGEVVAYLHLSREQGSSLSGVIGVDALPAGTYVLRARTGGSSVASTIIQICH